MIHDGSGLIHEGLMLCGRVISAAISGDRGRTAAIVQVFSCPLSPRQVRWSDL